MGVCLGWGVALNRGACVGAGCGQRQRSCHSHGHGMRGRPCLQLLPTLLDGHGWPTRESPPELQLEACLPKQQGLVPRSSLGRQGDVRAAWGVRGDVIGG